jgi:predicted HTH transcriptional regulator
MTENNRIEYKRELTEGLEKEVVAFLNSKDGGVIYLGLDNDVNACGVEKCDKVQLAIKDQWLLLSPQQGDHAGLP